MNDYSNYIRLSKYSRWLDKEKRRETWRETISRYVLFFRDKFPSILTKQVCQELADSIYNLEVMPSMRALWTAGPALDIDNIAGYNCVAIGVSHPRVFDEIFYLLMNGCGVGYSVERKYVEKLPEVAEEFYETDTTIVVSDSKIGWASALRELVSLLYSGKIPRIDTSKVRPAGARLKTFGGRACLTGDTVVYKDRKKKRGYNEITIKDLFDLERSMGKWEHKPNHFKDIKLRSLDENSGMFFRNNIIHVVDNGHAPVYEVITENGYRIKATGNHRFLNEVGEYTYLSEFSVGDIIAVNGSKEMKTGRCTDCGRKISRRAIRCRDCFNKTQLKEDCLPTTARQRKQCRDYLGESCEICRHDGSNSDLQVHHKDKSPYNNNWDNLATLCEKCHRIEDIKISTFGDPYSHKYLSFDSIISIEYLGVEKVYDLQMQGPNHNFVANGFVSHNSGPRPLERLFRQCIRIFKNSAGRRLNSLEVFDIICHIANAVIVGSVRRAACICLSNLTDDRMRNSKAGEWYISDPQRALANISVAYTEKPDLSSFAKEFMSMHKSRSGERGIVNKQALKKKAIECGREYDGDYLLNPCGEAILRDTGQACNLSEVIIRPSDTLETLKTKVRLATILGTLQSTLTNFRYLRPIWKKNIEEERLLGVSFTGIMDNTIMGGNSPEYFGVTGNPVLVEWLNELENEAVNTNTEWADKLGISSSKQIGLVKPSGTVSQLVDSSSGIHPRMFPYYIRNVRQDVKDPLSKLMIAEGIPYVELQDKYVFQFPIKAPENCITSDDVTAISQLKLWKIYRDYWCHGNPSQTVYYTDSEFFSVADWVWNNFDSIGGLSFFPKSDHIYELAPYEKVTEERYVELCKVFPKEINWNRLSEFEKDDETTGSQEVACSGGACEI